MKIGDLVFLRECQKKCVCPVCSSKSSRFGVVIESWRDESDGTSIMVEFNETGPLPFWSHHDMGDLFSTKNLEIIE